jgi:hypothetical protein
MLARLMISTIQIALMTKICPHLLENEFEVNKSLKCQ